MKIKHKSVKHPLYCHFGEKIILEDMSHTVYGFNGIQETLRNMIRHILFLDVQCELVNKVSFDTINVFLSIVIEPSEYEKIKISKKSVKGLVI